MFYFKRLNLLNVSMHQVQSAKWKRKHAHWLKCRFAHCAQCVNDRKVSSSIVNANLRRFRAWFSWTTTSTTKFPEGLRASRSSRLWRQSPQCLEQSQFRIFLQTRYRSKHSSSSLRWMISQTQFFDAMVTQVFSIFKSKLPEISCFLHRVSPPYSHQSKGTVERFHKTLSGQVRAIRIWIAGHQGAHSDQVEGPFMPWLLQHAVYQINRYLVRSDGKTSYEKVFKKVSNITHWSMSESALSFMFSHKPLLRNSKVVLHLKSQMHWYAHRKSFRWPRHEDSHHHQVG